MYITDQLFNIKDFLPYSNTYVESGSCNGESIRRALEAGFKRIKSVELDESFYRQCVQRFKDKPVELFWGKSTDHLNQMLADVYVPAVIFLDAHPAGPGTGGHEEFLKGNLEFLQDNILRHELSILLDHRRDHLIIIDDQTPGSEADYYIDYLRKFNPSYEPYWYDEQLREDQPFFKNKILVCAP